MNFFPKQDIEELKKEFKRVTRSSIVSGADSVSVIIWDETRFVDIHYYCPDCYEVRLEEGRDNLRFKTLKEAIAAIREYENELFQRKDRIKRIEKAVEDGLHERGEMYMTKNYSERIKHIYIGSSFLVVTFDQFLQTVTMSTPVSKLVLGESDLDDKHVQKLLDEIVEFRNKQRRVTAAHQ